MASMRTQMSGQINVEVDAAPQQDLNSVLAEIRDQYESITAKKKKELQAWFDQKVRLEKIWFSMHRLLFGII